MVSKKLLAMCLTRLLLECCFVQPQSVSNCSKVWPTADIMKLSGIHQWRPIMKISGSMCVYYGEIVDDICATRADTIYVVQHRSLHLSPPADVQALKYSAQFVCIYLELCTVQRMPTTCTFSHLLLCVLLSAAVKPQRLQRFS